MGAREIDAARNICRYCPVRRDCLIESIVTEEPTGIWGGITGPERVRLIERYDPATPGGPLAHYGTAGQRSLIPVLAIYDRSPELLESTAAFTLTNVAAYDAGVSSRP